MNIKKLKLVGLILGSLIGCSNTNKDVLLHKTEFQGSVSVKVYCESKSGDFDYLRMDIYDSNEKLIEISNSKVSNTKIKIINEDKSIYELRNGKRYHTKDKISE